MIVRRRMPGRLIGISILLMAFGLLIVASRFGTHSARAAGPWTVDTTSDTHAANPSTSPNDANGKISLRSAIEAANAQGGSTTILLPAGSYQLSLSTTSSNAGSTKGEIPVGTQANTSITIQGQGTASNTIIQQTVANSRIFNVDPVGTTSNVSFSVSNVTMTGGVSGGYGGGAILGGGPSNTLTLTNDVVTGNSAGASGINGGAISWGGGGNLNVSGSTFSNNSSVGDGGAIEFDFSNQSGNLTVTNSTFTGNQTGVSSSAGGGAIFLAGTGCNTYTITSSTFTNNSSSAGTPQGGGAINIQSGTLNLSYSRIVGNHAPAGTGVYVQQGIGASVAAIDNWWGCNGGPGASGCDTAVIGGTGPNPASLNFAPWFFLSNSVSPSKVLIHQTATLTAQFLENGTSNPIPSQYLGAFVGLPVAFTDVTTPSALGTLSPSSPNISSTGTATSTFLAGSAGGIDKVNAEVDNATSQVTITINQPPSFTSASNTTFTAGTSGSFTIATAGYPTPSISESGALPSGVTFKDNGNGTATLSGTPGAGTGGAYTLSLAAKNGFGTDAAQTFTLTVDQAPAITSANKTTFTITNSGSFTVSATGYPTPSLSESGALPTGVTFKDNGNGTATLSGTPTASGNFSLSITAHNGVGTDAVQAFTLTVGQPPAFTSASNTIFIPGTAGSFTITTSGFPPPGITESGALPNGVTFKDNGDGTATLSGTPGNSTSGVYNLTLTAINGIGTNATQNFTLTVGQAPAITSAANATFIVGQSGTFTVKTTGAPAPTITETGSLPGGVTFKDNGDGTATLSGTPESGTQAVYDLTFKADNGIGTAATQSFTLTVGLPATITSVNHVTFTVGTAGSFSVTSTGFPTPSLTETGALPSGITFKDNGDGTATLSGTPASGTGNTYSLTVKAHNGIGADAAQNFTLTVDQAPAITSAGSTTFTVGTSGSFSVTSTGFPTPGLSEIGALPTGVTFKDNADGTATLTGTPTAGTGGLYPLKITASNGIGTAAIQTFNLTVDQAPAITSANHATFEVGTSSSFTVTATGYPTSSIFESGALPAGVTFKDNGDGTATVSGTPAVGTAENYPLTFTASNGVGTDALQSFTLTISQPPAITSVVNATFTVGSASSFTVTTTGFPVPAVKESGSLPGGVTFKDNGDGTATLGGTPAAGSGGVYKLTLTASNGVGSDALQDFTLTVDQAPAITSANKTTFVVGTVGTFNVEGTGFPIPALSESGTLPSGVTFKDNGDGSATLSGTPAPGTNGDYSLTFTAANGIGSDAGQTFTLTVDQISAITSSDNATFTVGTAGSFTVTATGFPTPAISESGALPSGVTLKDNGNGTATLSGTPDAGAGGVYQFSLTAHNGVGNDATQTFTLTVHQAPAITSASKTTFTAGSPDSFTIKSAGFPTPSLTESGTLPKGVTFTDNGDGSATLGGTPAAGTGGIYPLTIAAKNDVGSNASQDFTLTIDEAAGITSADSAAFTVGIANSFTVKASGFPTPSLKETGSLPNGVTFVDNGDGTASLSGTPLAGTSGSYPLTIIAHNGVGIDATQQFTLDVSAVITKTTVADTTATVGASSVDFHATVTGANGITVTSGSVTFTVSDSNGHQVGSPVIASVSGGGATGTFKIPSGTPAGAYSISAAYSDGTSFQPSRGSGKLSIAYGVKLLYNPNQPVVQGFFALIRLEVTDANGNNLSNRTLEVLALDVAPASRPWDGQGGNFIYRFIFNQNLARPNGGYELGINTWSLSPGTYLIYFKVEGDSTLHTAPLTIV